MGTLKKIYIVHGWAYDTTKWQTFLDLLEGLGYEPVILSVPGLTAPLERAWTIEDYVDWLNDSLKAESEPIILLAHSNGGRISLAFVSKYPEKVSKLILIGSAGVFHHGVLISLKRSIFKFLAKVGKTLTHSEFLKKVLYRLARVGDYNKATPIMKETMANLIAVDLVPKLSEIKTPTLLLWGARDNQTPIGDGKIMAEHLPNAHLFVLPEAGHSPHFTHPEKLIGEIKTFLDNAHI